MKILFIFITLGLALGVYYFIPTTEHIQANYNKNLVDTVMTSKDIDTEVASYYSTYTSDYDHCIIDIANSTTPIKQPQMDIDADIAKRQSELFHFNMKKNIAPIATLDYWTTVHSIESKQGKLLYRPSNKYKSCSYTASPCGHHQLSLQALKDISCNSLQCRKDRENFTKSLTMSKQLQERNNKRLLKAGYSNLPEYQEYLIHQQGVRGFKMIIAASKGEKSLSRNIKRNMSGNSSYSYKALNKMGNKLAAKSFLKHWEHKWKHEKSLIIASQRNIDQVKSISTNDDPIIEKDPIKLPLFNKNELMIALNLKI